MATWKSTLIATSTTGTTKIVKLSMSNVWLPEVHERGLSPGNGIVQLKSHVAGFEIEDWLPYGMKFVPPEASL